MDLIRSLIILFVLLLCLESKAKGNNNHQLNVVALSHTSFVEHNKKGAIDYMLKNLSAQAGIEHEYEVTSSKRGHRKFKIKSVDCIFPTDINLPYNNFGSVIQSKPFANIEYFAFSAELNTFIAQPELLNEKLVGIVKNNGNLSSKLPQVSLVEVNNINALTQLLEKGRVDIAIYNQYDLKLTHLKNIYSQQLDRAKPIYIYQLGITCHNTPLSQRYIKMMTPFFDTSLKKGLASFYQQSLQYNQ